MKHRILFSFLLSALLLNGCAAPKTSSAVTGENAVEIKLSDSTITVNGTPADSNTENSVYIENDIVYYESGKDFTYGEGTEEDAHSAQSAAEHTVVHITQPGTYRLSGSLSKGQIAVDLGSEAKDDPNAVVTLILNGADITCEVAPAVIFYNVYECGSTDTEHASRNVDTSRAGANVILADGSENTVNGSYVARIYKPGSVVLNEAGTEVEDAKKLHKYDAAFYSKMSMNVSGENKNDGKLTIHAENEGLDSELHLTINGGNIQIHSGNDGINTNEDGVSVTTINGGALHIQVTGETGEGDGIDSNGWLVINGGTVIAQACAFSADAGIDSDMGIHINGGTVIASGNMLDRISESEQIYAVLNSREPIEAGVYHIENSDHTMAWEQEIKNRFTSLIISSADMVEGDYTLRDSEDQLIGTLKSGFAGDMRPGMGQIPGGMIPPGIPNGARPERPEDFDPENLPEGFEFSEGMTPPDGFRRPDDMMPPEWSEKPQGEMPGQNPGEPNT